MGEGLGETADGDDRGGLCKLHISRLDYLSLNSWFGNTHRLPQEVLYMGDTCLWKKGPDPRRRLSKTAQPPQPAGFRMQAPEPLYGLPFVVSKVPLPL